MEIASPAFIETYDYRPNRLFIEYLIYPERSFSMLAEGHLSAVIFSLVFDFSCRDLLENFWLGSQKFFQ